VPGADPHFAITHDFTWVPPLPQVPRHSPLPHTCTTGASPHMQVHCLARLLGGLHATSGAALPGGDALTHLLLLAPPPACLCTHSLPPLHACTSMDSPLTLPLPPSATTCKVTLHSCTCCTHLFACHACLPACLSCTATARLSSCTSSACTSFCTHSLHLTTSLHISWVHAALLGT